MPLTYKITVPAPTVEVDFAKIEDKRYCYDWLQRNYRTTLEFYEEGNWTIIFKGPNITPQLIEQVMQQYKEMNNL